MGEKLKQGADNMKTLLTFVLLFVSSAVAVLLHRPAAIIHSARPSWPT